MVVETRKWDVTNYLQSEEDIVAYLNAALEDTDPEMFQLALGDVARARGMAFVAQETGLGRESLYKAFRPSASPSFRTVSRVANALGARLALVPINH